MTLGPHDELDPGVVTPGVLWNVVGVHPAVPHSIPQLYDLDQPHAEALLKELYIKNNPKINDPLKSIFVAPLRQGISFALAIIEAIIQRFIGDTNLFLSVQHALDSIQAWRDNLHDLLGNPLLGLPNFDLPTALQNFITTRLKPTGLIATLLGGRLEAGQEPQSLVDTWTHMWGQVFKVPNAVNKTESDFAEAVRSLFNLSDGASAGAATALSLFNFPAAQKISTNPTVESVFNKFHLRKFTASGSVVSTSTDPESLTVTQTQSAGLFIPFDKSRDVDVFTFKAKATGVIDSCKAHVWRMDTTVGAATQGDVAYIATVDIVPASLPTAAFDNVYAVLPQSVHVNPGTVLGGEVCKVGAGTLLVAGIDLPWDTDDLTARPKRFGWSRNSGTETAPPATIVDASVPYTTRQPAIGLGQALAALPPPKYTYADSFNDTNNWKPLAGGVRTSGGVFQTATSGINFVLFNPAVNSDQARVEFDLRTVWSVLNPSFNDGDIIRLLMFVTTNASQWVGVEIEANAQALNPFAAPDLRIVSGSGLTAAKTVRSTDVGGIGASSTDRIGMSYDTTAKRYDLYINNMTASLRNWVDSSNVISHGPGFRQAGIYASFGQANQDVCDNFVFKDV